jgi:hypothetical protein
MAGYEKNERFMGHSEFEVIKVLCNDCIHFLGRSKCKAFPKRIPQIILSGENKHSKPLPGQDNEYVFERVEVE